MREAMLKRLTRRVARMFAVGMFSLLEVLGLPRLGRDRRLDEDRRS